MIRTRNNQEISSDEPEVSEQDLIAILENEEDIEIIELPEESLETYLKRVLQRKKT